MTYVMNMKEGLCMFVTSVIIYDIFNANIYIYIYIIFTRMYYITIIIQLFMTLRLFY